MAEKNLTGVCRLCRKRKTLCKSHYLGRVLHKLAMTNGQPGIVMTPKVTLATYRQLWAHLLCKACEGRLNKLGESPTFSWIDNGNAFPLFDRMNLSLHIKNEGEAITFSGSAMGVDTTPIAYFALALLWKGSIHRWPTAEKQTTSIQLGIFREPIRKFLRGGPFPEHVYVLAGVCEDRGSRGTVYAPSLMAETKVKMFSFLIRGLWFHVIADAKADPSLSALCCYRSDKKVLHLENCHRRFVEAGSFLNKTARVAPNVRS
jgi:hypothetical protein